MLTFSDYLEEKAKSKAQQRLFGLALSVKDGDTPESEVSQQVRDMAKNISKKDLEDYAKTKHKGLPDKVNEEGDLYTDDKPNDTAKGTGYSDKKKAQKTIDIASKYNRQRRMAIINTMYYRAKHHANQTQDMRDAMKVFKTWIDKNKIGDDK
jgi:hypothetical protein